MVSVDVKHHVYLLADSVGAQWADKECPFSGETSVGNLEEGAGKRCSECALPELLMSLKWMGSEGRTQI